MAGHKLALTTIDQIAFGEIIPTNQKTNVNSLKSLKETSTLDWLLCLGNHQQWERLTVRSM
ncbi:hypothetical protein LEMLEM_LOCUS14364 [Lemmus lemmus]